MLFEFIEFITASLAKEKILSKTRIDQAFKMFDIVKRIILIKKKNVYP